MMHQAINEKAPARRPTPSHRDLVSRAQSAIARAVLASCIVVSMTPRPDRQSGALLAEMFRIFGLGTLNVCSINVYDKRNSLTLSSKNIAARTSMSTLPSAHMIDDASCNLLAINQQSNSVARIGLLLESVTRSKKSHCMFDGAHAAGIGAHDHGAPVFWRRWFCSRSSDSMIECLQHGSGTAR